MFRSLRGSTAAKNAPPAPVRTSSAFSAKKAFAPPPVRRAAAPVPEPEPEPEPEEVEEEEVGEWAEALYDFTGQVRPFFWFCILPSRMGNTDFSESTWVVSEGGGRSGFTRGRESARDGTDFSRLVRLPRFTVLVGFGPYEADHRDLGGLER